LKRNGIYARDEYRCVYCGLQFPEDELTLDHVQPRVRGGDRSEGNLVTACRGCNTLKGQRRLSEFLHEYRAARATLLRCAVHLWPRQRRLLIAELAELDASDKRKNS
jgi:5-methylcytosine-specific restriction endonuclease McrA